MSDRTWNPIDSKLYEEDWSEGAVLIAACILTRCPDQYGVHDMPWGFLNKFFKPFFTRSEINGLVVELESGESPFLRLYRDRSVVWIVKKWKRSGKPAPKHWQGVRNHLMGFPEVTKDFLSYYEPYWKEMEFPLEGDAKGMPRGMVPPVNPDTDSDTDSEKELTNLVGTIVPPAVISDIPEKSAEKDPPKLKKPKIPIEEKEFKTPIGRLVKFWHVEYHRRNGIKYSGDMARMSGQIKVLLARPYTEEQVQGGMAALLSKKPDQFRPHDFDHFVKKASKYILEGEKNDPPVDPVLQARINRTLEANKEYV